MIINLPLKQLVSVIPGVTAYDGDSTVTIRRIASLHNATSSDMAVILERGEASVFDPLSVSAINKSSAGVFLTQTPVVEGKNYIVVQNVLEAFTQLVAFVAKQQDVQETNIAASACIHPSAVIESGVWIDEDATIGALVFVGKDCIIGRNVMLYPGVRVLDGCQIGDNTIVHAGTVIGSDGFGYEVTKMGLKKIPQIGIVRIGKNVEIGANCMIDRATFDETVVDDGVKMDNGVHIAHNVVIGAATAILALTCIGGSAKIGIGCQIGGQVAIKDHVTIGNGVKIVSKSGVMNDLKDGEVVCGIPAVSFSLWKRMVVAQNRLPEIVKMAAELKTRMSQPLDSWWRRLFR